MNLADRIVALEVGSGWNKAYAVGKFVTCGTGLTAEEFTHSWEVAGALMEKCCHNKLMQIERWEDSTDWSVDFGGRCCADNESLPHAIILACVEALSE